jgi:energy-coupling factor transport system ATP-binding protein
MIQVQDVTYRYPGEAAAAVSHVSLEVESGRIVGIVGPNGSGKSTLGRLIKGLFLPSEGVVLVDGLDTREAEIEVRRLVGLLFQNPNSQIVNAVVEQEVAFGPENLGLEPAEIRHRVDSALASVGLLGHELMECHSLSMADKQRVALASVIAMEPRYLILDEPTAWLEPVARGRLLNDVLTWARSRGAGVILVTHRMEEAQRCSMLYGMRDGVVRVSGTPEEVLLNEQARALLALDLPDTFSLARDLRAEGLPVEPGAGVLAIAAAICEPTAQGRQ